MLVTMTDEEKVELLYGPYKAPPVHYGEIAFCQYRQCDVAICGWSYGLIRWPVCHVMGGSGAGRGLLIEDELARAIRSESSTAIQHWWGASRSAVRHWRRAFGIGRTDTMGSLRLIHGAIDSTLAARRYNVGMWDLDEEMLVGKLPDEDVGKRIGRSAEAVAKKRKELKLPPVRKKWLAGVVYYCCEGEFMKTRKCKVFIDGQYHEAVFHLFGSDIVPVGSDNEPEQVTVAIVELPDGQVKKVPPDKVKFLDKLS